MRVGPSIHLLTTYAITDPRTEPYLCYQNLLANTGYRKGFSWWVEISSLLLKVKNGVWWLVLVLKQSTGRTRRPRARMERSIFHCWNIVGKDVTRSKTAFGSELNSPFGDPVYCHHLFASAGSLGPTSALCVHGGGLDTRLVGEKEQLGATS